MPGQWAESKNSGVQYRSDRAGQGALAEGLLDEGQVWVGHTLVNLRFLHIPGREDNPCLGIQGVELAHRY